MVRLLGIETSVFLRVLISNSLQCWSFNFNVHRKGSESDQVHHFTSTTSVLYLYLWTTFLKGELRGFAFELSPTRTHFWCAPCCVPARG